jgi:glycosyltransferase involved in cell wall biosynthesis/GT2 family glycosyltransferase
MKLSVIIPTYNRKETLKTTLLSLNDQIFKDFEVIVADDGSSDGTEQAVKALTLSYPIRHVWQKNSGRSAARNMGLEKAAGEIILFIDDHIVVDSRLIEEHVKYHGKYGAEVVRGRVEFIEEAKDAPKGTEYVDESGFKAPGYEQQPFRIFITNNISIKKRALMSVFGFDEDFKEYGLQDAEMGWRLKESGCRFKVNPNAVGYIFGVGWTYEQRCLRRRQVGRSSVLFYKKHPSLLVKINLSAHLLTILIQKVLSMFEKRLPKELLMFYNFSTGVKEGFEKYNAKYFSKMHSRFKGVKQSILFVSHISDLSGAPISLSLLVKNLNKGKYHPIVALPDPGPIKSKLNTSNINYQVYKDNFIHKIFPSLKIYRILKERQIDLIYLNTSATIWAAKAARPLGIPVISHIREDLRGPNNLVIRAKIRSWSDKIILISNWMKSFIRSNKAVVVHNAIDISDFRSLDPDRVRLEFDLKGKIIVFVGSLEERKGVRHLIKAFPAIRASVPDAKLLIVGKPLPGQKNYLNTLKSLAKNGNIIFMGTRPDVYDVMAAGDLLVAPSLSEPFGRIIIEAMGCGKPVVATNVGGIPEIIEDGKTGLLVPPGNEKSLADAVIKLLTNRPLADSLAAAGRERAEKHFDIGIQVKEIERIIDENLKK